MGGVLLAEESAIEKVVSGCSHDQHMAGVLCGSRVVDSGRNDIPHRKAVSRKCAHRAICR